MPHIVIIGAGQAGAALAAKLRALGHAGRLTLIGDEAAPPYQRPPLSKKYLLGEMPLDRLYLRPPAFYAEAGIDLRLGQAVTGIDRARARVTIEGEEIAYDRLALATGAAPRRLPAEIGGTLEGVHVVRSLADVDAMAPAFRPGARVLIVGGGYIGLEAAAVASRLGLKVTLIEAAPRILQRVAAPETADWFRALHAAHGVEIREATGLTRLLGETRVTGAELADGSIIEADFVILGIGVAPATALAEAAGLTVEAGIAVDAMGRTSDPAIWAAGDCTSLPYRGGRIRLESVQNAIDQAEAVAANMLGADTPYVPKPWFWSDQYDVKLQIAGLNLGYDRVVVRPGDRAGSLSHWYYRGAELLAVDAMNDPRAYMTAKRLIETGRSPDPESVATGDLKALMAA
ncbi:pyridine nucleotide-disulfide oxidoreductase [Rhodovulum viride]|uniref:Pyridine nucleotide-disulfide oxidoreductase n=1 Tax=Rhodovulum viride TaxID=1231134 RepID=A0ABX9DJN5_9RHOB|nr:FAD-dependent oxidoreductase [Rhodovulum viride]RAP41780.1 pyridine nucleotide-disulfide oxidoreductase [Rhodovulum viride]